MAPQEEELLPHLVFDISVDDGISFVVFMDHIKGFPVPSSDVSSLSVLYVVGEDSSHFLEFCLKVNQVFRGGVDLTESKLLRAGEICI